MHTLIPEYVQSLLVSAAPAPTAKLAAEWLMANADRFTPESAKASGVPERIDLARVWHLMSRNAVADKRAAGAVLMAAYCREHGVQYLTSTENLDRGLDWLAAKFHYADRNSLRQHQPDLYVLLSEALARHPWRNYYYVNLMMDEADMAFSLNTFWKGWLSMADGRWRDLLTERQKSSTESAYAQYDREGLFAAVLAYMEAHRDRSHTYNEVAKALRIKPGAVREIMPVKDALERLCDPNQGVYRDVVKFKEMRGRLTQEVYRWAPARRRLADSAPHQRAGVVSREIMAYLDASPYKSVRDIERHCRDAFGRMDNTKVRECLAALVTDKVALVEIGPRGAHLHHANPKITDNGVAPGAVFPR